jgi:hypothetical protein
MSRKGPLNRRSLGCARDDKGGQRSTWPGSEECPGTPFCDLGSAQPSANGSAAHPFPSAAEGSAVQRTFSGYVFDWPNDN